MSIVGLPPSNPDIKAIAVILLEYLCIDQTNDPKVKSDAIISHLVKYTNTTRNAWLKPIVQFLRDNKIEEAKKEIATCINNGKLK